MLWINGGGLTAGGNPTVVTHGSGALMVSRVVVLMINEVAEHTDQLVLTDRIQGGALPIMEGL